MSAPPDIDPYAVLSVAKDATLPEIRSAHRKRVLKCHPDKIQDESQRGRAQDEFQQVQQAYELLSDPARRTKYDQKARLADLRRERMDRGESSPYSSPRTSAREYRDGRMYEERAPAETNFFDEEVRFTEEPRPMSRKYDDSRRKAKGVDERRRSRGTPMSTYHAAKEMARDSAKAAHSSRAKNRTRERKRDAYEKYERAAAFEFSDGSDSSEPPAYSRAKRSSGSRREYEPSSRRSKPKESSRRREVRDYDDDHSDEWESKHDHLHTSARDYILRSRGSVPIEVDSRRASQSPLRHRGYESAGPDSRRRRSSRDRARRSNSRSGSYEHLDSPRDRDPRVPSMPTMATSPGLKMSSRPTGQFTRSATANAVPSRAKREDSGRSNSALYNMVYNDAEPPRSKLRDRYDSGYSSGNTPEAQAGTPRASTRYKIVTEPETVLVEPDMPSRRQRGSTPPRQERPPPTRPPSKPVRTYTYSPESSGRYESKRPPVPRSSSSRPLFGEVEYSPRLKGRDVKYAREIGPDDVVYTRGMYARHSYDDYRPPVGRRQSAYA